MIWSGLTKYLQSMLHGQAKAVEIPNLVILGPFIEKWANLKDPLDKGTIVKSTYTVKDTTFVRTVIAALNEDFVQAGNLSLETRGDKAVASFNKSQREEILSLFSH